MTISRLVWPIRYIPAFTSSLSSTLKRGDFPGFGPRFPIVELALLRSHSTACGSVVAEAVAICR